MTRDSAADVDAFRQRIEPRSRAEYAADLEQQVVSGWDRRSFGPQMGEPLDGQDESRGVAADRRVSAADEAVKGETGKGEAAEGTAHEAAEGTAHEAVEAAVDRPGDARPPDTPFQVVRRFEPRRAGLPEISAADAVTYIDAHCAERPWLATARGCSPEVQRIFAALDQGGGHGHIRHEGWVTEEMNERRVTYLEDPAQRDLAKRVAGIDGIARGDRHHRCGDTVTRLTDPDAFAVAFARGTEHPRVRHALGEDFDAGKRPAIVSLPVEALLGPDGHRYCTGWQLEPVGGSMNEAQNRRATWVKTRPAADASAVTEPSARPVDTFVGGSIVFVIGPNRARDGYEIATMYPRAPDDEEQG
jgi:hypothetical protein